ncbi:hypothetical protein DQQ10_22040 [Pseudochryseolinea flava]|uniref:Uncharacterized protein n=1 Tax=Pseudochryseolinea flava TaxID=2059302 RepID=A0A364XWH6_9BACT|nr:hypothetical protein DQQ10_22040 [Pseudochryseolinea flava]
MKNYKIEIVLQNRTSETNITASAIKNGKRSCACRPRVVEFFYTSHQQFYPIAIDVIDITTTHQL